MPEHYRDNSAEAQRSRKTALNLIAARKIETQASYIVELQRVLGESDARALYVLIDNLVLIASGAVYMLADQHGVEDLEVLHWFEKGTDELSDHAE